MRKKLVTVIIISVMFIRFLYGQTETYTVSITPFSSGDYDEFSPVYYKNGIVFCSNRSSNLFLNYTSSKNKGLFKIFYVETTGNSELSDSRLFSNSLTTKLNDGPVTFSRNGDTIYYSRNINEDLKKKDISGPRNKLGIFSAQLSAGEWVKVREFRLNNEWSNITTPCLSPNGSRLYFASDKPGGFGGSDLYYCQMTGGFWTDPVNLGKEINTPGDESYPFVNLSGELYFASDGHPGLGGKDIFFSGYTDSAWLSPVHINPPVNSEFDDFGFISDPSMHQGYFSSNRNKSFDIFSFKTNYPQIFYNRLQKEDQYCFLFRDSGSIAVDTTFLRFSWTFGDGKSSGKEAVNHCYEGPGNYNVSFDIVDRKTGKLFFTKLSYSVEIKNSEQPYISSSDIAVKGEVIEFDAMKSYLPGYEVLNQSWDFGDGKRSSGAKVKHEFANTGEYNVNLGLTLKSEMNGDIHRTGVSKKILVLSDLHDKADTIAKRASVNASIADIKHYKNAVIKTEYSAESEIIRDIVFTVEVLVSPGKADLNSSSLSKIPQKYKIKEIKNQPDGNYSYCIDPQMSLMAVYPAYRELLALGFKDLRVRSYVLTDPSEKELYSLIKNNGASTDSYFDSSDKLTSIAYIMLDQIVKLMYKYPSLKLEVGVHTDNTGSAEKNIELSQRRSLSITGYIINRGISASRLVAKGFGGSKPVAPNFLLKDRRLNQRVDFNII